MWLGTIFQGRLKFEDIRIVTNSTNKREKQENIINDKVAGKNQTAREVVRFLILYVGPLSVGTSHHCLNKRDLSRWSVTSLRGPGERNFNALSHKPELTGTDWIELNWCARWFMGYGIKISFPRPPQWRHRSPGLESHCLANVILYHVTEFSCRLHVHHICE